MAGPGNDPPIEGRRRTTWSVVPGGSDALGRALVATSHTDALAATGRQ
jgi:hypothetical protein